MKTMRKMRRIEMIGVDMEGDGDNENDDKDRQRLRGGERGRRGRKLPPAPASAPSNSAVDWSFYAAIKLCFWMGYSHSAPQSALEVTPSVLGVLGVPVASPPALSEFNVSM